MSGAKNVILGFLSFFLIIFLSLFILTLTFSLTINEKSLNSLINNNLDPFVDEQINYIYSSWTEQEIESSYQTALYICQTEEFYEIARQGDKVINLDCSTIRGINSSDFLNSLKSTIKNYVMNQVTNALDNSKESLRYISVFLWIFSILSAIFVVTMIIVAGTFPFKSFGAVGIITGSPAIFLLILKSFIEKKIQDKIQNMLPAEMLETFSNSSLNSGVVRIISEFFIVLIVAFGIFFILGIILLAIGIFFRGKKQNAIRSNEKTLP